jgi:hypothetical protein
MKLVNKKSIPQQTCYDLAIAGTHNFFANGICVHNTNAAVVHEVKTGEIWAQSRSNVITPENDNAGFARFVKEHEDDFARVIRISKLVYGNSRVEPAKDFVAVYGEWCGKGIQNGVGINELPKMFVVFAIRIYHGENERSDWFNFTQIADVFEMLDPASMNPVGIYSITQFPTWKVNIDFMNPEQSQNKFIEITTAVEQECPVAKQLGVSGVGEGVVWTCEDDHDLLFKVKGEKHSVSKVKTLAAVDVEKVGQLKELVTNIMTENRMKQMLSEMKEKLGLEPEMKNLGHFIKLCVQDALKEETDTIVASGFDIKEFTKVAPAVVKNWFISNQ